MVAYDLSSLVLIVTHNCFKKGSVLQPRTFARNSTKPSILLRNTIYSIQAPVHYYENYENKKCNITYEKEILCKIFFFFEKSFYLFDSCESNQGLSVFFKRGDYAFLFSVCFTSPSHVKRVQQCIA